MMGNNKQLPVSEYLRSGKRSVIDIMQALHVGDPRSVIRHLRKKGYDVRDEWRSTVTGSKYKIYWIDHE